MRISNHSAIVTENVAERGGFEPMTPAASPAAWPSGATRAYASVLVKVLVRLMLEATAQLEAIANHVEPIAYALPSDRRFAEWKPPERLSQPHTAGNTACPSVQNPTKS